MEADTRNVDVEQAEFRPYTSEWYEALKQRLGEAGCRQLGFYVIPDDLCLSVVVPVYNEEQTLASLVDRVAAVPIKKQMILVDDSSADGSWEIMQAIAAKYENDANNSLTLARHSANQGKGAALRTGFEHATGDIIVIQDADLEYDPSEYPRLIQPIVENKADVVFGSRFLGDRPHRVLYYWHYLANQLFTLMSNCFTNLNLTDMETCYKVFRRDVIQSIAPTLKQNRFGFEPEVTAKVARRRYRVFEMSISYSGRTYEEGKKIGWRDGISAFGCIIRYGIAD